MSSVNLVAREVAVKIVFYGPGLSGKTTSLRKVYETVRPAHRGEMMSIATEGDRTLFFDFLPVKVERVNDCTVRLALYTVPGQVFYNATRKLVLQGADGVVFVADSQPEMMDANRESLANLEENLLEQGVRLERFPLVFQWNKRDIPKALPVAELRAALNPRNVPDFETEAISGRGVMDALKAITRLVIQDLRVKRIVPPPRTATPAAPSPGAPKAGGGGLEAQLTQLAGRAPAVPTPATATARPRPRLTRCRDRPAACRPSSPRWLRPSRPLASPGSGPSGPPARSLLRTCSTTPEPPRGPSPPVIMGRASRPASMPPGAGSPSPVRGRWGPRRTCSRWTAAICSSCRRSRRAPATGWMTRPSRSTW